MNCPDCGKLMFFDWLTNWAYCRYCKSCKILVGKKEKWLNGASSNGALEL